MKFLFLITNVFVFLHFANLACPIYDAATKGDIAKVKAELHNGVDVNTKIQHGWSPMHEAAMLGHIEVAKLLISKGANINLWDGYDTPLDVSNTESVLAEYLRKTEQKKAMNYKMLGNKRDLKNA